MGTFEQNIISIHGEKGKEWLKILPILINEWTEKWNLHDLKPYNNLTFNYVLQGQQNNTPIVLKVGIDNKALAFEACALKAFDGFGGVRLLMHDEGKALLLERAVPGISLKNASLSHKEKREILCKVMKNLHKAPLPNTHSFPYIKDWLLALDKEWPLPNDYIHKARKLRDHLLPKYPSNVLLHGDLHHDNVIRQDGNWVVIDPKGVIGSPLNEVWAYIIDIEKDTQYVASYFGFDVQDVRNWYFVHVMLAVCWNLEDNINPDFFMNLASKAYHLIITEF